MPSDVVSPKTGHMVVKCFLVFSDIHVVVEKKIVLQVSGMENASLLLLLNTDHHIENRSVPVADVAFFIKFARRIPVVKDKDRTEYSAVLFRTLREDHQHTVVTNLEFCPFTCKR